MDDSGSSFYEFTPTIRTLSSEDSFTRKSANKFRVAIREALVNAIIHCDFLIQNGIHIIRYSDRMIFRNGGRLRISKEDYYSGGHSDPRNNYIQEMFRFINLCERAGTGVPKIMDAVRTYHFRLPEITTTLENFELTLWDTSILHDARIKNPIELDILRMMLKKNIVTINSISDELSIHRNTAGKHVNMLVDKGIVEKHKSGKINLYRIAEKAEYAKYSLLDTLSTLIEEVRRN